MSEPEMNFSALVKAVRAADDHFAVHAVRAVNLSLTLRNWFIGLYISEFELHGADRAAYGESLLKELSRELSSLSISNVGRRQLYRYLSFHRSYPQIVRTLGAQSLELLPPTLKLSPKTPAVSAYTAAPAETLVSQLSYSHFELLLTIKDEQARRFYEIEAIRGQWSVRELLRQI